jgi:hypothetical protein
MSKDFSFTIGGQRASLEEIFPDFNAQDRIGIIVSQPCGVTGASCLLMAAITRFYDVHRMRLGNERGKLRIYPDYFVFHVGKRHGIYREMDIWPPHKEIDVENDPEQILEAINDRGITRLLVEDIPPSPSTFLRETVSSAEQRIVSTLAYSSTGRVNPSDVVGFSPLSAEYYVLESLRDAKESKFLSEEEYHQLRRIRNNLVSDGIVMETYRRIELFTAIQMLTTNAKVGESTRRYISESHPCAQQEVNNLSLNHPRQGSNGLH